MYSRYPSQFPLALQKYIDRMIFELRLNDMHMELYRFIHKFSFHNGRCTWYCSYRMHQTSHGFPHVFPHAFRRVCDCAQSCPLRPSNIRRSVHRLQFFVGYPAILRTLVKRVRERRLLLRCIRCEHARPCTFYS